jgi:hypothetical protein
MLRGQMAPGRCRHGRALGLDPCAEQDRRGCGAAGRREKRRGEPAKQTENRAPWFLLNDGRGERIRTPGLRYPKPSRYQTALRPDARFLAGFFRNEKA